MLIVCPSCASEYTIDAGHVRPEGRTVRCAACRTTWRAMPGEAEAPLEAPAEAPALEAFPAEPAASPGRTARKAAKHEAAKRGRGLSLPRRIPLPAAAALALLALGSGALAGREAVVRRLPQAAGLYAAVGLPVNLRGVALADVVAYQNPGEAGVLVVEGDVTNPTRYPVRLPDILVEVRDGHDQPVYHWTSEPPRESLDPAERARFRARLAAPPAEGRKVLVRFADAAAPAAPETPPAAAPAKPGH